MRRCGECTLCCRLLPVRTLNKPANQRCKHQRHTGCMVYNRRPWDLAYQIAVEEMRKIGLDAAHNETMPPECAMWNCRWLVNDDTGDLSRPDRSHYVVDLMPDFVTGVHNDTGEKTNIEVIQIWVDPKHPDAHKDPDLRRYLERRALEGKVALIRFNERDAFTLIPPSLAADGAWHELKGDTISRTHTAAEVINALGEIQFITDEDHHGQEEPT
jgi:hypothetical protein